MFIMCRAFGEIFNFMLDRIAREINLELASKSSMEVGKTIRHPDGRMVKIINGCFLDSVYGRVSNFWTWRPVLKNNKLGKEESGYGW